MSNILFSFAQSFAGLFGSQILIGDNRANTLEGGDGDDLLIGNGGADTLIDGAGNDIVLGGGGNDLILAGGGRDIIDGGRGRDTVSFEADVSGVQVDLRIGRVDTDEGAKLLFSIQSVTGGAGSDEIIGNQFRNELVGGAGADVLDGRRGDDTLDGGSGSDTLTGGRGSDSFAFSGDPFDGADVSDAGRQIVGDEDFITDFGFRRDDYLLNATDFGVTDDVVFAAVDATDADAQIPAGANVIVLLNADNDGDPDTPFLAGTAANQIAELVDQPGAGFFVYFNSNLQVNRLVYSTDLSDATADLKILSRQTNLEGQDAIDALARFTADNFTFEDVVAADDVFALNAVVDGATVDGNIDNNGNAAVSEADIATGDTIDLSGLSDGVSVDLDASNQGALNPAPESQIGTLSQGDATVALVDIENVIGTEYNDTLFGNNEANVILGGAGDDNIHPFGGTDFVDGGEGTDVLNLSAATGITVDLAAGVAGPNTFVNFENVLGSVNGDDIILGDASGNDLNGRGQNDILDGRGGSDTLTGGDGEDTFAFSGDPFDGADVSADGRQIIGNEDFITDFDFGQDTFAFNATDFGVDALHFASADANAPGAADALDGANVIVLQNADSDGDPDTPFLAGTAANQIADLVDEDGAGFFVYFNTNLDLNRLVYSENLNDATADLKIVARQTDLTGQDAIDALGEYSADNFALMTDDFALV
ncbi:MAG: calcium-binding protein [Pseudomonadota bacterium]